MKLSIPVSQFTQLLLLVSFVFASLTMKAQSGRYVKLSSTKKDKASVVWMGTTVGKNNKILLKAKIFASFPLEARNINLLINDRKESSKAEFGSLYGNAEYEFTYERELNLLYNENKFQLQIKKDTFENLSSALMVKNKKVSILNDNDYASRILWTFPDPAKTQGHTYRSEASLFHFSALIKTGIQLQTKSSVKIILNSAIMDPKGSDKLLKIGHNLYEYKGSISLDPSIDKNEIFLRLGVNDENIDSKTYEISVDEDQPSLYLLSMGTLTNLEFTSKDAEDFAEIYGSQSANAGIFQNISVDLLNGIDATTNEMKGRIEELNIKMKQGLIKAKDLIILYISSHGFIHESELRIQGDDYDPSRKRTTSISFKDDIMRVLDQIHCKKLFFLDACHSGEGQKENVADINYEIEKLNKIPKGITTFVSSQGDELSYEDKSWENGAFTEALISGLSGGEADKNHNYVVTVNELFNYLKVKVPRMVMDKKGKPQNPKLLTNDLGDVAIYFVN